LRASPRDSAQFIKLGLGGCDIGVSYAPHHPARLRSTDLTASSRPKRRSLGPSQLSDGSSLVDDALEVAETLCRYGKFGLESTKQLLWANLDASSLESALHVENRSQILASTSGEMRAFSEAFRHRQR
jgi:enoyl-CoA hydratase/carnithine racemase